MVSLYYFLIGKLLKKYSKLHFNFELLPFSDKKKLKKFCKGSIITETPFIELATEETMARIGVWQKECGLTDSWVPSEAQNCIPSTNLSKVATG